MIAEFILLGIIACSEKEGKSLNREEVIESTAFKYKELINTYLPIEECENIIERAYGNKWKSNPNAVREYKMCINTPANE